MWPFALAVVALAGTLAGCDCTGRGCAVTRTASTDVSAKPASTAPIPLPRRALLTPQPAPRCEFDTEGRKDDEPKGDDRQKLDYERQCYRHAEIIVRGRLHILQASVDRTVKAVRQKEGSR